MRASRIRSSVRGCRASRTVSNARARPSTAVERYFLHGPDAKNVHTLFAVTGGGGGASGQNSGQAYINLAPFDQRKGAKNSAEAIVNRASGAFRGLRDAQVFALVPGAIRGLGQAAGFSM